MLKRNLLVLMSVVIISILSVAVVATHLGYDKTETIMSDEEQLRVSQEHEITGTGRNVKCTESLTKSGATRVLIEFLDRDSHIYKESMCIDYNTIRYYSCNNFYPETPITKKCALRCFNGHCVDSFNEVLNRDSLYLKDQPVNDKRKIAGIDRPYYKPMQETYQPYKKVKNFETKIDLEDSRVQYSSEGKCTDTDSDNEAKPGRLTLQAPNAKYSEVYDDRCKDYSYKFEYSCKNAEPTVPSLVKCNLRCVNGECIESYAQAVRANYRRY
ncbi:MAG: hypothetical protein QW331_01265 [Candidatus Woesearchaeota archaeon]